MTVVKNCVVVGVDDSSASRAAHRWARSYALATAADLRAVHVLDWPIGLVGHPGGPRTRLYVPTRQVAPSYRRRLHRALDDSETAVDESAGPTADSETDIDSRAASSLHFAQGPVGEVLVRLSTHAALLVIGTREPLRDGHRLVTGSACHYCVSHATCPVVTVPEPPPDLPTGGFDDGRQRDPLLTASI